MAEVSNRITQATLVIGDSSNVEAVSYHYAEKFLSIQYKGGRTYVYHGVPFDLFLKFMSVESVGKFVAEEIKGKYHYVEVDKAIA